MARVNLKLIPKYIQYWEKEKNDKMAKWQAAHQSGDPSAWDLFVKYIIAADAYIGLMNLLKGENQCVTR